MVHVYPTLITGGGVGTEDVLLGTDGLETGQQSSYMSVSDRLASILGARLLTGNRKARDCLLVVELEAKTLGVGAQDLNVSQLEVHPVLAVEDLGAVLGLGNRAVAVAVDTSSETGEADTNIDGGQVGLLGSGLRRVFAEALIK